jgi:hypothetical protein
VCLNFHPVRFWNSPLKKKNFSQHVVPVRAQISTVKVTSKVYVDAQEIKTFEQGNMIKTFQAPDCHEENIICHGNHNFGRM